MKLSQTERDELKKSFKAMDFSTKVDYIWTYFKIPIIVAIFFICFFGSGIHKRLTDKEPVVYMGLVNVTAGDEVLAKLSTDYIDFIGENQKKKEVRMYKGLYLAVDPADEDHEYAYASRMKIMSSINAKQLDVVLMNKEAYDIFSNSGYLLELTDLPDEFTPFLTENEIVLSDNSIDVTLNTATELIIETETKTNGLILDDSKLAKDAGFDNTVYAGILANTERYENDLSYLHFLVYGN